MTTVVLNRRNLIAAGGCVLATGVSGLLLPARWNQWCAFALTTSVGGRPRVRREPPLRGGG
jgi:hypothetical protein